MNTPYHGALLRASVVGLLAGLSTFLATWSTTGDAKTIGIASATAFLAPFVTRWGGEGTYDTNRDTKMAAGDVSLLKSSDVGFRMLQSATAPSASASEGRSASSR